MRVGFAGTPGFARVALEAIVDAGFEVPLVLTQPDRPRGRGLAMKPTEVKEAALRRGLSVLDPAGLKGDAVQQRLFATPLDVLVVAAYGLILPPPVLHWPRHGALNIHASLLPRWRGAAPVQRAILAGDRETGITIMQMDTGLDTGPMVLSRPVPIDDRDTAGTLLDKLSAVGSKAVVEVLQRLDRDQALSSEPQPGAGATYASKVERREGRIDWSEDVNRIDRQVRAFDPAPGAHTLLHADMWKVWHATPHASVHHAAPGTVLEVSRHGVVIACAGGTLCARELQPPGGKRLSGIELASGRRVTVGDVFQ
ncbi:MAG: methionyl-tRNA formyltransferase [Pseudomonadota bacterium]|nr:methionyl-tRNA formyltransferase [Pseudomonadota bacterium]